MIIVFFRYLIDYTTNDEEGISSMKMPIHIAITFVLSALLTACTPGEAQPSRAAEQASEVSPVEAEAETRLVQHTMGETEIPADPQRIIILDERSLGAYTMLDRDPPLAACALESRFGEEFGTTLTPLLGGRTQSLGDCETGYPLERIVTLNPDLILGADVNEETYEELSAIAPTIFLPFDGKHRLDLIVEIGRVFDMEEEAQGVVNGYLAELDRYRAELEHPPSVALISMRNEGLILYGTEFFTGTLLDRMGLPFVPVVQDIPGYRRDRVRNLSYEQLSLLESTEVIVVLAPEEGSEGREFVEEQIRAPIWQTLPAVQRERVLFVPERDAFGESSVLGVKGITDMLFDFVQE